MVVFFVKSNENTYPKGRSLMHMYRVVPLTIRGNSEVHLSCHLTCNRETYNELRPVSCRYALNNSTVLAKGVPIPIYVRNDSNKQLPIETFSKLNPLSDSYGTNTKATFILRNNESILLAKSYVQCLPSLR